MEDLLINDLRWYYMASKKHSLSELKIARLSWKNILEDALDPNNFDLYTRRKKAVDMYIDGMNVVQIEEDTKIHISSIGRLIDKCCKLNPTSNEPYGYVALLRYKHTEKYTRKEINDVTTCTSGLFESFLSRYPTLKPFISDNYFGNREVTLEKCMKVTILHHKFIEECRNLGIKDYEYPLNTDAKGLRSLRRYVNNLKHQNEKQAMKREGKDARQRFSSTGSGRRHSTIPIAPYSIVQLDGHKIDMLYTVQVENSDGTAINLPATRMWLIAVVDVATRTILGYSLTTEENYNQIDVLSAIKDSIHPRKRMEFKIPGFDYPKNGGFPCFAIQETNWAMFDTIMLDNAKAHLAHDIVNKITQKLRCSVTFGSVATPEARGIVERFFGTLEENGYHRLPSTTGSNSRDMRRENAEKDAVKYGIKYNDIVELTEYLISIYNNSPHSNLSGRTPLQVMEDRIKSAGMTPFIADNKMRETVNGLTNIVVERTVRGSYKSGKRPYISYEGVSISLSLVGAKLLLEINTDDISSILAYTEEGIELGYLRAMGEWGRHPHSLKTRKEAMKYARKNKANSNPFFAPLTGYENELRERATKSRIARTKGERISREKCRDIKTDDAKIDHIAKGLQKSNMINLQHTDKKDKKPVIQEKNDTFSDEYFQNLDGLSFEEAYEKGLFK